jgi:hypothetical protein
MSATYKGLLVGAVMIILSLVFFYGFKLPANGFNQFAVLAVFVIGLLWSLISLKIRSVDPLKFKDYFSEGFKTFIVVTLLMVVYTIVFYKLNPQILEAVIKENNELVMKDKNYMASEVEANANKLRSIFMPMMLAITTIKFLLLGAVISAIGAVFLNQQNNPGNK